MYATSCLSSAMCQMLSTAVSHLLYVTHFLLPAVSHHDLMCHMISVTNCLVIFYVSHAFTSCLSFDICRMFLSQSVSYLVGFELEYSKYKQKKVFQIERNINMLFQLIKVRFQVVCSNLLSVDRGFTICLSSQCRAYCRNYLKKNSSSFSSSVSWVGVLAIIISKGNNNK